MAQGKFIMHGLRQAFHRRLKPRKMRAFYADFIPDRQLCFDIGANEGKISKPLLDLGHTVLAVEPQATLVQSLRTRFNKERRFKYEQVLVSNADGKESFFVCENSELSTSSPAFRNFITSEHGFQYLSSEEIKSTTLDRLIQDHGKPYYVKIDVEGGEYKVLEGLSQQLPVVSFEFIGGRLNEAQRCLSLLQELGEFRCNLSLYEDFEFYFEDWIDLSSLQSFLDRSSGKESGEFFLRAYSRD